MKLNEFLNMDSPSDKIVVTDFQVNLMLENPCEIDTDAFLYAMKSILSNLPSFAAERGTTQDWNEHPMFGINSDECKDKWAVAYQQHSQLADKIFNILIERSNDNK